MGSSLWKTKLYDITMVLGISIILEENVLLTHIATPPPLLQLLIA